MTGSAATILIVDDELKNRKLLETLLKPEGYATRSVANGEEVLASIAAQAPDLILLDVMMPGLNGFQIARRLKAEPATSNIPIIMLTALGDHDARVAGLDAGVEEFLTKPVDRAELSLRVRNLLRLKALADFHKDQNSSLKEKVQEITVDVERLGTTNESLEHLSSHDALTGLANRRLFDKYLADQMAIARRHGRTLALVMCDVDLFKSYNDSYGHPAGDECLKQIAATLRSCCRRPADLAARYGGEEFAMILPETDMAIATRIAEAARDLVMQLKIPIQDSRAATHVSISGGIAVLPRNIDMSPEQLISVADRALYQAKELGRNRIQT